jgi:hypothetical protein
MTQPTQVEFEVAAKEFQNAVQQLLVNREDYEDTDIAEIKVGNLIGLRAVGTETSLDGMGKQYGAARLPVSILSKLGVLAGQFKKKIVTISLKEGVAKVEPASVKHPGIVLGEMASAPISIPVDASALDVLATSAAIPASDISDAGLKARVTRAIEAREAAVEKALDALKEFGVEQGEIQELVDKHIREIAKGVKKALGKNRGLHSV